MCQSVRCAFRFTSLSFFTLSPQLTLHSARSDFKATGEHPLDDCWTEARVVSAPSTSRMIDTHWMLLSLRPRKKVVISATMGISLCENTTHVTGLSSSCAPPPPSASVP